MKAKACLLVIDLQEDFLAHPVLAERRIELVDRTRELVETFRAHHQPVIWVKQTFAPDLGDAYLEMRRRQLQVVIEGSPGAELLAELDVRPREPIVVKKRYSAFFGTELDQLLEPAPGVLVVAGVNTHACVRMTIIDAYQRDLRVAAAAECIASNDLEHDRITRRYLHEKMAWFLDNAEIAAALEGDRWPFEG